LGTIFKGNFLVTVLYKHWKKDTVLEITGVILYNNPQSDRIVVVTADGIHEDIIRDTIIEIKPIGS